MTAPPSLPPVPGDRSRRAGICVEILGWLTLLRLDLIGLVMIKAGRGVRARDRKWWKVAVGLLALHVAVWLLVGGVLVAGSRGSIGFFFWKKGINLEPWLVAVFGVLGLVIIVPLCWLLAPATRRAMKNRGAHFCVNCGYDLRASKDRCPECAQPFERPVDSAAAAAARLSDSVPALPEMPHLHYSAAGKIRRDT